MAMKDPQARTKQIIKDDIETIRAYADAFGVEMPDLDENGEVVGRPRRTPARSPVSSAAATASTSSARRPSRPACPA